MRLLVTGVLTLLLAGCSALKEQSSTLEQQQRESVSTETTADVTREAQIQPPNVTITATDEDGVVLTVEQPVQMEERTEAEIGAAENSDSSASGNRSMSDKFPWWVQLIGGGIALIVITVAVLFVWSKMKNNIAVKAVGAAMKPAFQWVNDAAQSLSNSISDMAASTTNEEAIRLLNAAKAQVERFRAEANKDD